MDIRKLVISMASIAAISPTISYASPESVAAALCARAFASSLGMVSPAANFKLKYRGDYSTDTLAYYYSTPQYRFYLQANGANSRSSLAGATCTADMHGNILALAADGG